MEQFRNIQEIEQEALQRLTKIAKSYYTSGANNMVSLREANKAFAEFRLKPAAEVDEEAFEGTQTTFIGQ